MYPLFLDLTGRRVVVVGGGCVATRRARGLVEAGAAVEVIAPEITDGLRGLVASGAVAWTAREYRSGDLMDPDPAWVAHTATGVREVDALVSWEAAAERIWCVNAADRDRSTAWTPAVARGTARPTASPSPSPPEATQGGRSRCATPSPGSWMPEGFPSARSGQT